MKYLCLLLTLVVVTSCASIRVNYDYEKTTDFTAYKTYNYYANLNTGMSELDDKRLLEAIDQAMQRRGYTLAENPDFFIDIKSLEFQQQRNNNVGVGVGGTGRNVGGGISIGLPIGQSQLGREIVFEFVDENKNGLFWQAVSESNYKPKASPEKKEAQFVAIVEKVLEGFPPESN
ncbi:DUF4136 domain-containing protein [Psychroserpens sp. SPM9]|uniref:DUF4136 domain-containing protein n=1 Tax=Psychroserpens sp. SPM9 TaxID=2975598 RepID=UPI0021A53B79|nr:DUF4136 domain-containing protein [Psychroserpens sp. SPM9]MDG5492502.1 DUF4136 domain-containing protein [Psychroserpens sp. SPM9]